MYKYVESDLEKNHISRETRLSHLNYSSFNVVILLWFDHTLTLIRKKNYFCFMEKQGDVKQNSSKIGFNVCTAKYPISLGKVVQS